MVRISIKKIVAYASLLALVACGQKEPVFTGVKVGKPYEINGQVYYPEPDSAYDKVGEASWYGPGFDGNRTASGEIFDQDDLTAAHPTLPMPSLVKVTNLSNDRSVIVRINDRGPFHSNRIIDLSKKSAERIGLKGVGSVRVQFLGRETDEYVSSIKGKSPRIDMFAYNENYTASESVNTFKSQIASYNNSEIEDFAPIESVSVDELGEPSPAPAPRKTRASKPTHFIISDAMADDTPSYQVEQPSTPKPQAVAKPKPVQPVVPVDSGSGNYMILAGSFSVLENAQKLANQVASSSGNPNIYSIDKVNAMGTELWRLQFGSFANRESAEDILRMVQSSGAPDARIVRR